MIVPTADLLSLFILFWVKSSIVVGVGFMILLARRIFRVSTRAIWMTVFASVAALPFLNVLLPVWEIPLLSASHRLLQQNISLISVSISFIELVAILWVTGAALLIASLIVDHVRARRLIDHAEPVHSERIAALLTRACAAVGCTTWPRVLLTERLSTPALVGPRSPVLILPKESSEWDDEEIFAVICHELFHLMKRDLVTNILERIVAALVWVNPVVHVARRYSAFAREIAADQAVLRAGVRPELLARRMIDIARRGRAERAPAVALTFASFEGTRFETRIKALFSSDRPFTQSRLSSLLLAGSFALMVVSVGLAQIIICVPEPTTLISSRC
ncbi:MAG TPA: M56 family metallopeptidase [Gemmatimonadaceae bacterium]|nr:M56 family metallopeptidase [Gemmatimonadaceae bacterium]